MNINKLHFKMMLSVVPIIPLVSCQKHKTVEKPNIIVMLVDDAGYSDFGFMGCKDLESPNIDKLAKRGVVFTDAHVSATVCSPSRAGLMTGRYQQRFGHECNCPPAEFGTDTTEKTMADVLKTAGYKTIGIGKWHLGDAERFHPNNRGFDEFFGFLEGGRQYFLNKSNDKDGDPHALLHNKERVEFDGYLTDVFGDKAVEYIEANKDRHFFMYFSPNAVHTPMQAKKEDLERYKDHPRQKLAAMTWSLDHNVGKIVAKLEKENLLDNTLIFFLSDNGGATTNQSCCLPLKGWKGNKFEGGHRIPFFMAWTGKVKGDKRFAGLTSSLDIMATAIQVAGVKNTTGKPLDGVNLMPFVESKIQKNPHEKLYWRKEGMAGMRYNDFKLIRVEGYGYRLYNVKDNIGETKDLRTAESETLESMKIDLKEWETGLVKPLWSEGKYWNTVTYEIHQSLMENKRSKYYHY